VDATIMESLQAILPEILVLVLIGLVLSFDSIGGNKGKRYLGWVTFGGLLLIILISIMVVTPPEKGYTTWGGMISYDFTGFIFKLLFLFGAAVTVLLAMDVEALGEKGEFYSLLLVSVIGMMLMVCSYDLIMLFLAIETTSIPVQPPSAIRTISMGRGPVSFPPTSSVVSMTTAWPLPLVATNCIPSTKRTVALGIAPPC